MPRAERTGCGSGAARRLRQTERASRLESGSAADENAHGAVVQLFRSTLENRPPGLASTEASGETECAGAHRSGGRAAQLGKRPEGARDPVLRAAETGVGRRQLIEEGTRRGGADAPRSREEPMQKRAEHRRGRRPRPSPEYARWSPCDPETSDAFRAVVRRMGQVLFVQPETERLKKRAETRGLKKQRRRLLAGDSTRRDPPARNGRALDDPFVARAGECDGQRQRRMLEEEKFAPAFPSRGDGEPLDTGGRRSLVRPNHQCALEVRGSYIGRTACGRDRGRFSGRSLPAEPVPFLASAGRGVRDP